MRRARKLAACVMFAVGRGYWERRRTASRHSSMSHVGVDVAPEMPSDEIELSHWGLIWSGPSMR